MNPFYGVEPALLVTALADARSEILNGGKALTQWGAGDTSGTFTLYSKLPPERRIELIWAELCRLNPTAYPCDAMRRRNITTARFNDL